MSYPSSPTGMGSPQGPGGPSAGPGPGSGGMVHGGMGTVPVPHMYGVPPGPGAVPAPGGGMMYTHGHGWGRVGPNGPNGSQPPAGPAPAPGFDPAMYAPPAQAQQVRHVTPSHYLSITRAVNACTTTWASYHSPHTTIQPRNRTKPPPSTIIMNR